MTKAIITALCTAGFAIAAANAQITTASDNFDGNEYNPAVSPYNQNGGTGFGPITYLTGNGGGAYFSNFDGRGLGIFAGENTGNTQALAREILNSVLAGTYSLSASFNITNTVAFTGFNLKSTLGSQLGEGELLSIGLLPEAQGGGNDVLYVTDGTGTRTVALGADNDLTFNNIDFSIAFDTGAQTYSVTATVRGSNNVGMFSGILKDTNGADPGTGTFGAVGFGIFNTGANQDLLIDNLVVTAIPEPSTVSLLAVSAIFGGCFYARRRNR